MGRQSERGSAAFGALLVAFAIAGGAVVGTGLVLGNVIDPVEENPSVVSISHFETNLLDCRNGEPIARVADGDSVLAVAIDDTGSWVAVRRPGDLTAVGWLPATQLRSDDVLADLPVASCDEPAAQLVPLEAEPTDTTSPTPTVPPVTAPPVTTPPVTAPPVTTPPDTAPPVTTPPDTAPPDTAPPVTTPPTSDPGDTHPPGLSGLLVEPDTIFPGSCPPAKYPTTGTVYVTVTNETEPVSGELSWRYLPTQTYDYSGTLPVTAEPGDWSTLLIGAVSGLPDPYPPAVSAPPAVIEFRWLVSDSAGNLSSATITADLGRCS
jgi:hypothetical protein